MLSAPYTTLSGSYPHMQPDAAPYLESNASDSQLMSNEVVIGFLDYAKARTERTSGETTEKENRWLRDILPAVLGVTNCEGLRVLL